MRIVVDIDGYLVSESVDVPHRVPFVNNIRKVNKLYDLGHEIILHTARGMKSTGNAVASDKKYRQLTEEQLTNFGVKFHSLYFGKPNGEVYLDNKNGNIDDLMPKNGKRLLIVLGDSFSAGCSSWDPELVKEHGAYNIPFYESVASEEANSWPTHFGKMAGCDVLNLAVAGSSNKVASENLINHIRHNPETVHKYHPDDYDDVYVVFACSAINRTGFTSGKEYTNINPTGQSIDDLQEKMIHDAYTMTYWSDPEYALNETYFSILNVQNWCKAKGYRFMFCDMWAPNNLFHNEVNYREMPSFQAIDWEDFMQNYRPKSTVKEEYLDRGFELNKYHYPGYDGNPEIAKIIYEYTDRRFPQWTKSTS